MLDRLKKLLAERFTCEEQGGTARFDGIAFEKMCWEVLTALFGEGWTQTPISGDEGRDFERLRDRIEWAECKMHKRSLGLQSIGSTLIMALVESVCKLAILSFSPLSDEGRKRVFRFAASSDCTVELLDGDALIRMLVAIPQIRASVFPDLSIEDAQSIIDAPITPEINSQITLDAYAYKVEVASDEHFTLMAESDDDTQLPRLQLGATVALDVFLRQGLPRFDRTLAAPMPYCVRFTDTDGVFERPDLTSRAEHSVISGQMQPWQPLHIRIPFRIVDYRPVAELPVIDVCVGETVLTLPRRRFQISPLPYTTRVIGKARDILNDVRDQLSGGEPFQFLTITGRSGVGKSRLLHEVASLHLRHGYGNCLINGEEYRSRGSKAQDDLGRFGRILLSRLFDLPLIEDEALAFRHRPYLENTYAGLAEQLLYHRRPWTEADIREAARCCVWRLKRRKLLFLLDNVQFLDDRDVLLLRAIIDYAVEEASLKSCLYFVFNDDLMLTGTEAAIFRRHLQALAKRGSRRMVQCSIGDLDEKRGEVDAFLNALLSSQAGHGVQFTHSFAQVTARVKEVAAPRPLYLLNLLIWLQQLGLLQRDGPRFRPVPGRGEFHESIPKLPSGTRELLETRWNLLLSGANAPLSEDAGRLVSLFDRVPGGILRLANIPDAVIERMEELGFVQRDGLDGMAPWHGEVFSFLSERYPTPSLDLAGRLIASSDACELRAYPAQLYLTRRVLEGTASMERLAEAGAWISDLDTVAAPATRRFLHAFIDDALAARTLWTKAGVAEHGLEFLATAIDRLASQCSADTLQTPLDRVAEHFHLVLQPGGRLTESLVGPRSANALHLLTNVFYARNGYARTYGLLSAFRGQLQLIKRDAASWIKLVNRLAVSEMWLNRPLASIARGEEVRAAIQEQIRHEGAGASRLHLIEAEVDLGNVYATLMPDRVDMAVAHWKAASTAFDDDPSMALLQPGKYPSGMVKFYDALRLALDGRHEDARNLALRWGRRACDGSNLYHGVRCLLFAAITHFLAGTHAEAKDELRDILDEASDWCSVGGITQAEWGIHVLYGRMACDEERHEDATVAYATALKAFRATDPPHEMVEVRAPFIEELAIRHRQLASRVRTEYGQQAIEALEAGLVELERVVPTVRILRRLHDQAFEQRVRSYQAVCIFRDRGFFLPYQ